MIIKTFSLCLLLVICFSVVQNIQSQLGDDGDGWYDNDFSRGFNNDYGYNYFDEPEDDYTDDRKTNAYDEHSFDSSNYGNDDYSYYYKNKYGTEKAIKKDKNKELSADKNNVILIIGDDFGMELLGIYQDQMNNQGRPFNEYPITPTINRLVSKGIRFNRAYSYPICSPSRSSMLTGRFGFRTGIRYPIIQNCQGGLVYPQPTIPLSLPKGAKSAVFGKWHLRTEIPDQDIGVDHVLQAGFDAYDGLLAGRINNNPDYTNWKRQSFNNPNESIEPGYFTSVITDLAIDWIKENKDNQFFLWLAHIAPHVPLHKPPLELLNKDPPLGKCNSDVDAIQGARCAISMIESLDTEIDRLLNSIPYDVSERTTIIFLGDNGSDDMIADGQPFNPDDAKKTKGEGAIRVPFFISGNGVTAKGTTTDSLVSTVDIFQTVVEMMGGKPNLDERDGFTIDSRSLVPIMKNPHATVRDFAFSELIGPGKTCDNPDSGLSFEYGDAYITECYKIITRFNYADDGVIIIPLANELFNLCEDPFEKNNLLDENGEPRSHDLEEVLQGLLYRRSALLNS